jgi:nicotinate phosphoribosyltransferase
MRTSAGLRVSDALLTDLYQLNMMSSYLEHGITDLAVFELFFRKLPPCRGFLLAAGIEQALDFLEAVAFTPSDVDYLSSTGRFPPRLLDYLAAFRFSGDVDAIPEGTVFFPNEPVVRVVAPLPEAQFVETRLMNLIHFQTAVASKAARMVLAAQGKQLVDFGLRRAHGAEAGLLAARASYLAGFDASATVAAGQAFGIPLSGTMAHSFIQAHDEQSVAFDRFARSLRTGVVLLIDTYDTCEAARQVVALAPRLAKDGIKVAGVRIDSGDLAADARKVRDILDAGGLGTTKIVASGGLDEIAIAALVQHDAPIDAFGVGSSLATAGDAPALDCAYKLQEYAGLPRRKRSSGKATWPGRKQVWRRRDRDGTFAGDLVSLESDHRPGETLLVPVMRGGVRVGLLPGLEAARARAAAQLAALPSPLLRLEPFDYPVEIGAPIRALAQEFDRGGARSRSF